MLAIIFALCASTSTSPIVIFAYALCAGCWGFNFGMNLSARW